MLAFAIQEPELKDFMQHLFTHGTFCGFEVRGVIVQSFVNFEISESSSSWEEIRPYVRNFLSGRERPRAMKFVFARGEPDTLHPNAAALFINMTYEGGDDARMSITTATSQVQFQLDKTVDREWDAWVSDFFRQNGIETKEVQ